MKKQIKNNKQLILGFIIGILILPLIYALTSYKVDMYQVTIPSCMQMEDEKGEVADKTDPYCWDFKDRPLVTERCTYYGNRIRNWFVKSNSCNPEIVESGNSLKVWWKTCENKRTLYEGDWNEDIVADYWFFKVGCDRT